jgi:hypothetical protein
MPNSASYNCSLLDFARTGELGPIALGATRSHVQGLLGDPTDWVNDTPMRRWPIWKYGDAEVYFGDDVVVLIHFDTFDIPTGCESLRVDRWIIQAAWTAPSLKRPWFRRACDS